MSSEGILTSSEFGKRVHIILKGAESLPKMDRFRGKIDAFVVATITCGDTKRLLASQTTEHFPRDYDPVWNHAFQAIIPFECQNPVLRLELWDWDGPDKKQFGGAASLPLSVATTMTRIPIKLEPRLKPHRAATSFFHVITFYGDKSAILDASAPIVTLSFQLHRGVNLPKMDTFSRIDAFVKIAVQDSVSGAILHKSRTDTVKTNFHPVWNYAISIPLPLSCEKPRLQLRLYDRDATSNSFAGIANLCLAPMAEQRCPLDLIPGKRPSKHAVSADLVVSMQFDRDPPASWTASSSGGLSNSGSYGFSSSPTNPSFVPSSSSTAPSTSSPPNSSSGAVPPSDGPTKALGLRRLVTKPAIAQRVHNVKHMDPAALDSHFNAVLLDEVYEQLDTGDVLLFRGSEVFSKQIRDATRSNWSHAAFIVRDPPDDIKLKYRVPEHRHAADSPWSNPEVPERVFVFEAESETLLHYDVHGRDVQDGIQLVPIKYWLQKYYDEAGPECLLVWRKLARNDNARPISQEQNEALVRWIDSCCGARYKQSKKQCYAAIFRLNMQEDNSSFFCSELVAATLAEIGVLPKKKRFSSLFRKNKGAQLANNTLPCDFSSEERHDGKDIVLNSPYCFHRERRLRLLPAQHTVDGGAVVLLSDYNRNRIRSKYPNLEPFESLVSRRFFSGHADAAELTALLEGTYPYKTISMSNGIIRPYLALQTLHPMFRIRLARLLKLDIVGRAWFGDPDREAWEILSHLLIKTKILKVIRSRFSWINMLTKVTKDISADTEYAAPVGAVVAAVRAMSDHDLVAAQNGHPDLERQAALSLERMLLLCFRPHLLQMLDIKLDSPAATEFMGASVFESVDAVLAHPEGPALVRLLRTVYGFEEQHLLMFASAYLSPNGVAGIYQQSFRDWSVRMSQPRPTKLRLNSQKLKPAAFSRKRALKIAPVLAFIAYQCIFVQMQLNRPLHDFYSVTSSPSTPPTSSRSRSRSPRMSPRLSPRSSPRVTRSGSNH